MYLTGWRNGVLVLGEQGVESIHTSLNQIERSYLNMPNKVGSLTRVIQEHHLLVDPRHQQMVPPIKRRKLTTEPEP